MTPILVRAIVVGPDNSDTSPTAFPDSGISALWGQANLVYAPANISFSLHTVERVASTLLNDDVTKSDQSSVYEQNRDARQARAIQHPGELVIYFRAYDKIPASNQLSLGFSGGDGDFVAMPRSTDMAVQRLFAHEVGHYLHLGHTFVQCELSSDDKKTLDVDSQIQKLSDMIRALIVKYVVKDSHSVSEGLDALDGDRPGVMDTPPDDSGQLLEALNAKQLGKPKPTGGEACGPIDSALIEVKFPDGTSTSYTLKPARNNIMSYFNGCLNIPMKITDDQIGIVSGAIMSGNRRHLTGSFDGNPPIQWSAGWVELPGQGNTIATPAVAVLGNTLHVFVTGPTGLIFHNAATAGNTFGAWVEVPGNGKTDAAPAAAALGNTLHLFVKGPTGLIFHNAAQEHQPFGAWVEVPGNGKTDAAPAAAALGNTLHLFVKGPTGLIFHNAAQQHQGFGAWLEVPGGGETNVAPAAAAFGNRLYCFVKGTGPNIFVNSSIYGHSFGAWLPVPGGGETDVSPAAVGFADGQRLYVFRRGTGGGVFVDSAGLV